MYVTVEDVKKQTNVEFDEDDKYLEDLISVAESSISNYINAPLEEYAIGGLLEAPLRHAVLLIAANLYENREPISYGKTVAVPFTLNFLLLPYVKLT